MKLEKLLAGAVVFVVLLALANPAAAGGGAVSTLDAVPEPVAGQTVEVGFTIRQHGVTPVNPDGDVGIVLRSEDGGEHFFEAEPAGEVGHYAAEVTFPEYGTWAWAVRQGWFAEQAIGVFEVGPRSAAAEVGGYQWPVWMRLGLPALALVLAAGAALQFARDRRQRHVLVAT